MEKRKERRERRFFRYRQPNKYIGEGLRGVGG